MRLISSIILSMIVASWGSTSLASSSSAFYQLMTRNSLFPRLASDPCLPSCTSAEKSVGACKTKSCICTVSNAARLQSCVTCVIRFDSASASDVSDVHQIASSFNTGCAAFVGVPSLTLPSSPAPSTSPAATTSQGAIIPTITTSLSVKASSSPTAVMAVSTIPIPENSIMSTADSSSTTSTDNSATGGLPLPGSAIRNKVVLHGIGPLLGLVLGIWLVV